GGRAEVEVMHLDGDTRLVSGRPATLRVGDRHAQPRGARLETHREVLLLALRELLPDGARAELDLVGRDLRVAVRLHAEDDLGPRLRTRAEGDHPVDVDAIDHRILRGLRGRR